jgi:hypothetical protein
MNLSKHPHRLLLSKTGSEAKALLLELGVLHKLANPGAVKSPRDGMLCVMDHATHWILGTRSGKSDAGPEPYMVICYPKSLFSHADFDRLVAAQMAE